MTTREEAQRLADALAEYGQRGDLIDQSAQLLRQWPEAPSQQPAPEVPSVDYPATIDALRAAARNLESQLAAKPEFETRADGKVVRVDRWEWGIRRIVALLWGNRRTFEVDEVVQAVRELVPHPQVDDESLCQAVESGYGAAQPARPDEFVCPHCFDEGAAPQAVPQPLTREQHIALCEAQQWAREQSYFDARPQIDDNQSRRVFGAAFKAGYEAGYETLTRGITAKGEQ